MSPLQESRNACSVAAKWCPVVNNHSSTPCINTASYRARYFNNFFYCLTVCPLEKKQSASFLWGYAEIPLVPSSSARPLGATSIGSTADWRNVDTRQHLFTGHPFSGAFCHPRYVQRPSNESAYAETVYQGLPDQLARSGWCSPLLREPLLQQHRLILPLITLSSVSIWKGIKRQQPTGNSQQAVEVDCDRDNNRQWQWPDSHRRSRGYEPRGMTRLPYTASLSFHVISVADWFPRQISQIQFLS